MDRTIDDLDALIMGMLQDNARTTQADIAKAVGLAPSAVMERIRKLEARGAIRGYAALVAPRVVDLALLAFVSVRATDDGPEMAVAKALADIPEVLEVHHVAGDDCYLLKMRARDAEHLGEILRTRINQIPEVTSTRTTIVLGTIKESPRVPIHVPA